MSKHPDSNIFDSFIGSPLNSHYIENMVIQRPKKGSSHIWAILQKYKLNGTTGALEIVIKSMNFSLTNNVRSHSPPILTQYGLSKSLPLNSQHHQAIPSQEARFKSYISD